MRISKSRLALATFAVVAVLAAGAVAWVVVFRDSGDPEAAAAAYLRAWQRSDWPRMRALVAEPPRDFVQANEEFLAHLAAADPRFALAEVERDGDRATARFRAQLRLRGLGEWRYDGGLSLVRNDDEWLVDWSRAALHPALRRGLHLERTRTWPKRAPILAADGTPLATAREVIEVGVEPRRIKNRRALLAALGRYLGADAKQVAEDLDRPEVQPNWFVPVTELRPARYRELRPKIYPIPGTVFRRTSARLRASDDFALHVLGDVGEVTAEVLDELGGPYVAGDVVGLFGLERVFERRLAGRPSGEVRLANEDGRALETLARFEGDEPKPVRTTLDANVQAAAEEALDGIGKPAALVALDARSGAVRAAASRPLADFNRAFAGRYPPGSTFKIVTTAALLTSGVTPEETVPCPEEAVVGGKPFRNAEGAALGPIPFRTAFSQSCNTAFVQLAARLDNRSLLQAARQFGFGARYELPLDVAGGRFPTPRDEAERAAAGIGQGRVVASPIHMATVAAAVAAGSWRAPVLVAGGEQPAARPLPPPINSVLPELMRLVVAEGTGEAAALPGEPIAGKTGTAEFGAGNPPPTHAWFAGFRGELAFAVLVEGGGFGGEVAAPIAARFLASLDRRNR